MNTPTIDTAPETRPLAAVLPLPTIDTAPAAPTSRRAALELERVRAGLATPVVPEQRVDALTAADLAMAEVLTGPIPVAHDRRHDETSDNYLDRLAAVLRRAGYVVHPDLPTACQPEPRTRRTPRCRRGSVGHHLLKAVVTYAEHRGGLTADEAGEIAGQPVVLGTWRRFGELAHAGLMTPTGGTRASSLGRPQALYLPTAAGREHLTILEQPVAQ